MIVVVDYGMGNLQSVKNGFAAAGFDVKVSSDPADLARASGLVLPGVGAFGRAMETLRESGLGPALLERVADGVPLLGICLGLQLLFERSEEMGDHAGFGLLPGDVVLFRDMRKVPQVGWNSVSVRRPHPLLAEVRSGEYFYFVHSYHAACRNGEAVLAVSEYGVEFPAVVGRDNIFGLQFHPEKSGRPGIKVLANFGRLVSC
jgi:glutamine amidotransferase